jgi:DNA-binding PadR family transcriptional regulator
LLYLDVLGSRLTVISKDLAAASTTPILLSLLAQGESYGYELIQRVKEISGGQLEWSEGMLYPVLHRLEKEKLIVAEWKQAPSGRRRKYYRVSKNGHRALEAERQQWQSVTHTLSSLWNPAPTLI